MRSYKWIEDIKSIAHHLIESLNLLIKQKRYVAHASLAVGALLGQPEFSILFLEPGKLSESNVDIGGKNIS